MRTAKTLIRLGRCPGWADAQADPSLRWAHTHFVGFVMSRLILVFHGVTSGETHSLVIVQLKCPEK